MVNTGFGVFYYAGKAWLTHGNPYSIGGRPTEFVYPPTSLPLFGALALFDFAFASQLWWITYLSVFVAALLILVLTLENGRKYVCIWIAVLLILTSHPLLSLFYLGQSDLLVASLAFLSLAFEKLKHPWPSAVLLSAATLLTVSPVLLLIYFVVFRRDLRYLGRYLLSTLALIGTSLFTVPAGMYWGYLASVSPALAVSFEANWLQSVTEILVLVCFAVFSYWVGSKNTGACGALRANAMFLMNVLVILFLTSAFAIYSYVWAILPLALFLSFLMMEKTRKEWLLTTGLAACLLNSPLSANFLHCPIQFPLEVLGSFMLTLILIPISVRPTIVLRPAISNSA